MRRGRTGQQPKSMLGLASVGEDESGSVWKNSGLPRVASITTQRTNKDQALTELLRSWEKQAETLESKYLEVLDTLIDVMEHLVRLTDFTKGIAITRQEGV